jgi:hypothetical protein
MYREVRLLGLVVSLKWLLRTYSMFVFEMPRIQNRPLFPERMVADAISLIDLWSLASLR